MLQSRICESEFDTSASGPLEVLGHPLLTQVVVRLVASQNRETARRHRSDRASLPTLYASN